MILLAPTIATLKLLNEEVFITKNSKHIAIGDDKRFRFESSSFIDANEGYYDIASITQQKEDHLLRFGNVYLCSQPGSSSLDACQRIEYSNKVRIIEVSGCIYIMNTRKQCVTVEGKTLVFEPCENINEQCFGIERVNNPKSNPKNIPKDDFTEKRRGFKPQKDYDMRYVVNEIDEAQHELAEEDSSWIVTEKHFVPECFYGYGSIFKFLTDPLPNLTKLKQKYCMYNQKKDPYDDK